MMQGTMSLKFTCFYTEQQESYKTETK